MYARKIADLGFVSAEQKRKDRKGLYHVISAEKLSARELRLHLCDAGPWQCGTCGACAYGKEALRRGKDMAGLTQKQIMEKFGASSVDVSTAVRDLKPVGMIGAKWPSALYDEKQAGKALAGIWRGRANNYARKAQEWQARANEAEGDEG